MESRLGSEDAAVPDPELDVVEEALQSLLEHQDAAETLRRISASETVWLARQHDGTIKYELISNHKLIGDITIDEESGSLSIESTYISPDLRHQDWRLGEAAQLLISHMPPKAV